MKTYSVKIKFTLPEYMTEKPNEEDIQEWVDNGVGYEKSISKRNPLHEWQFEADDVSEIE